MHSSPEVKEIFRSKSIFPAYCRTKNLIEILTPSTIRPFSIDNQADGRAGFKCNHLLKRCDLCENSLIQGSNFQRSATGRHYSIRQNSSCSSRNVIYLATCNKCNWDLQYVSSSSTEFKVRFHNHKSTMLNNKRTSELVVHYLKRELLVDRVLEFTCTWSVHIIIFQTISMLFFNKVCSSYSV